MKQDKAVRLGAKAFTKAASGVYEADYIKGKVLAAAHIRKMAEVKRYEVVMV